jgi:hypothetical protein
MRDSQLGEVMTKDDFIAVALITSNLLLVGDWIDRSFFYKERLINFLIRKAKAEKKCFVCGRPMKVISESEL